MSSHRWLRGLGIVAIGGCLALGAGRGVATAAPDDPAGGAGSVSSSQSETSDPTTKSRTDESAADPDAASGDETQRDSADAQESAKPTPLEREDEAEEPVDQPAGADEIAAPPAVDEVATAEPTPSRSVKRPDAPTPATPEITDVTAERDVRSTTEVKGAVEPPETPTLQSAASTSRPVIAAEPPSAPARAVATVDMAAVEVTPTMTAPPQPTLISTIGTLLFTLLTLPLKLFEQTPVVPPGYSVAVGRSTLAMGCGCGQSVDARWYFPDSEVQGAAPQSLVYLQHGFFRSNSALSAMAIELAERTNSIVVTPTLTSNFFAYDGCWINGEPTQRAVADLFVGDRAALTQSAVAAGWTGGVLPTKFILSGQSAGGALATAAASFAVDNGSAADLLLVVMFDGVPFNDFLPAALAKLGSGANERQVLQIASPPYFVNLSGKGTDQLVAARPGQFVGVQIDGGLHADAEGPSSDIIAQLAAGFSRPENVKVVQTIAVEWINDVLSGVPAGAGAQLGGTITIPTTEGNATAVVLGSPVAAPPTLVGKELFT